MSKARTVMVLAAGKGTRMKSPLPKMLMPMLGRTLLGHVLEAARPLEAEQTVVVIGHAADQMERYLAQAAPHTTPVLQREQRGTGHAVRTGWDASTPTSGTVVVLYGDTPLLRTETLEEFLAAHEKSGNAATVLTAEVDQPGMLGRIVRDGSGEFDSIVEFRDASVEQREIREINSGIYAFEAADLGEMLPKLGSSNDQGEEYLTDVLGMLRQAGRRIGTFAAPDADDTLGCNDRAELARLARVMRDRVNEAAMRDGVTMDDPQSTWLDVTVEVEADVTLRPGVQLRGNTRVATGAEVGPDSTLVDTVVGSDSRVVRAQCESASVADGCAVGPFAYLRPGTRVEPGGKVGTYVEVKNSTVGPGAKVPHLSYVGDASVGSDSNLGAGTIVANYDGVNKHHTEVGEAVFVGSNSVLVAPVSVGDGAYVAAGSAVTKDVSAGDLGVARGQQHNSDGWVARRRAGTKSDAAARRARRE